MHRFFPLLLLLPAIAFAHVELKDQLPSWAEKQWAAELELNAFSFT